MSDIYVMWEPPKYSRYRNTISNYTLIYRKAPDMFNARKIEPHRDMVFLPGVGAKHLAAPWHILFTCGGCMGVYYLIDIHSSVFYFTYLG